MKQENEQAQAKLALLNARLRAFGRAAVAFSGGVDSTFLLAAAAEALGENAFAVTGCTASFPQTEAEAAEEFCQKNGIRQLRVTVDQLSIPGFRENPPERCYLCKKALFSAFLAAAKAEGADCLLEGSNADDSGVYRPGLRAIRELGVLSPLQEAGLTKAEIRLLSKQMGLPTWDKPSLACLATRIPYHELITEEKLRSIDRAEQYLRQLGFRQVRVRRHGDLARIELEPDQMQRLLDPALLPQLRAEFRNIGFVYLTLDLDGFQSGSMDKTLNL